MAAADIKIVVGAQPDPSAKQIREDLKGVQKKFENRPLKIRIGANITDSKKQISEDLASVKQKYDTNPLKIKIGVDTNYIEKSIQTVIPQIQKNLNKALSNAIPIQVSVKPNVSSGNQNSVGQVQDKLRASLVQTKEYLKSLGMTEVEVNAKVKNIQDRIDSLQVASLGSYIAKDIKKLETEVLRLNKVKGDLASQLYELKALFQSDDKSSGQSGNDITDTIKQIETAINNLSHADQITLIKEQLKALRQELQNVDISKLSQMEKEISALESKKKRFGLSDAESKAFYEARQILSEIKSQDFTNLSNSDQTAKLEKLNDILESVRGNLKEISASETLERSTSSVTSSLAKMTRQMTDFATKYKKLQNFPELQNRYNEIMSRLTNPSHKNQSDIIKLKQEVDEFHAAAKRAGVTTKSLSEWLGEAYQKFGGWALVTTSMMKAVHVLEQMFVSVRNLDSAMTELKKVTNETDISYNQFFQRASNQAKEIGTTMTNYINSTADFARLGYSLGDAEELAKTTAIYYNVADGMESIDEATASVISTMKAFGLDVKDSIDIVDLFNHTSNNFAISSAGIGEAMQRSASALKESGSTIEEAVALITAANSVIQDPMKVGNSLKTLSLRMRGAKVDLEEAGLATDGMAESTSKLRKEILALTGQKVDIMLDENTFKSPFKMLEELSQVWGSMTDINKAAALELLGGKQQANILASLIANFQTAKDVMAEASNATGSAMEENERQLDSINGKISQFKANFESLSATVIDSELVKGGIDFGSGLLHSLDAIMQRMGTFPTLLGAVAGGFASVKAIQMFDKDDIDYIGRFKNILEQLKVNIVDFDGSQRAAQAQAVLGIDLGEMNQAVSLFQQLKLSHADWTDQQIKNEAMAQSFHNASSAARRFAETTELSSESVGQFKAQQEAAITAIEKGSLASKAASLATGLFAGAMASLATTVISWGIQSFLKLMDDWIHKQERLAEATNALRGEYEALTSEISSLKSELDAIVSRMDELSGKHLTISEQGELAQLQAQRTELENILEIKEHLAEAKRKEASGKAVEYFENKYSYNDGYGGTEKGTVIDETKANLEYLKDLKQQIAEGQAQLNQAAKEFGVTSPQYHEAKADLENLKGSYENLNKEINENVRVMTEQRESLDITDATQKKYADTVQALFNEQSRINGDIGAAYSGFVQDSGYSHIDSKLQAMAQAGTLTAESMAQFSQYNDDLEKFGFTQEEVIEHYKAMAEEMQKATPPPIDLNSMEGLKTKLSEIIDKANVISAMDLNQAALSGGTEKQKEAWAELQTVMSTTGMTLEEIQAKVVEFGLVGADGAAKLTQAFIDANQNSAIFASNLSQITNRTDTLVKAYKELAKGQRLSSDVIMNLIQAYPQLETELTEYLAGLRSQKQIMLDLEAVYQADSENWKALMLAKLANSETFFQSILSNNAEWVTQFYENYGIDLSNCKSYAGAKLKIMQVLQSGMETMAGRILQVQEATGAIVDDKNHNTSGAIDGVAAQTDLLEKALNDLTKISMGGLEGQFQSLNSAIDGTTNKANEAASALRSIASTSLSAINSLLDMTMSMLKQDLTTQKEGIEAELQGLKADYDASKKQMEADKKAALNDLEAQRKALQDKKKAQDKAYDDQIKNLQKVKDAQNDIYDDQIKAAEDELDAYNKIIDAQLKLLRLKEEQHDYERELADKQKDVADIEAKLAELGLDDSIEAQKKRLELEEELAAKKDELDEFQHDKNISDQEQALEDEKQAFEDKQQAIIDGIQAQKDAYNEMIDAQIEGIRNAKQAFDDSIQAQLDALANQKEQTQAYYDDQLAALQRNYEADRASREQRKAELDKQINDTAALRKQAIELIQGKSDEFYQRLLEWNRQYGTGIDADVIMKWNNAYKALELFGGKQFNVLEVMNQLTVAGDGFKNSLEEAVKKAGDLELALRNALNAQAGLQLPKTYEQYKVTNSIKKPSYKKQFGTKYHTGGEVGKDNVYSAKEFTRFMDNLKSNEVPAVLEKKEWVLTQEQQGNILNLTNTQKEIIGAFERMYKAVSSGMSNMPSVASTSLLDLPSIPELATAGGDNTAVFNFNTTITGNADDGVMDNWFSKNVSAFEDRFARYTLGQVNFKRNIRTTR